MLSKYPIAITPTCSLLQFFQSTNRIFSRNEGQISLLRSPDAIECAREIDGHVSVLALHLKFYTVIEFLPVLLGIIDPRESLSELFE